MTDNFERVRKTIAEQLSIDESKITLESRLLDDLKADSLDIMELVMTIEEECDVEIADDVLQKMRTVNDIVAYLDNI